MDDDQAQRLGQKTMEIQSIQARIHTEMDKLEGEVHGDFTGLRAAVNQLTDHITHLGHEQPNARMAPHTEEDEVDDGDHEVENHMGETEDPDAGAEVASDGSETPPAA